MLPCGGAKLAARRTRTKRSAPASAGLEVAEVVAADAGGELAPLERRVTDAGGAVIGRYRDPVGGAWLALAVLPLAQIAPTPFQRDLSEPHAKRLADVIRRLGIYLDPVIAVPVPDDAHGAGVSAAFWSPNGLHRLTALGMLGARTVTALVSPDTALAYRILALNTEKAHSVRERALEAVRMARGLAGVDPDRPESELALELEEGALVTLGLCYEARPRFAGGAYAPALRASDAFLDVGLTAALETRGARAKRLLAIDDRVAEIIAGAQSRGFDSPYLRNFVVSRPARSARPASPRPLRTRCSTTWRRPRRSSTRRR